ncbi:MAG: amylo-alpha-1,6-glucosidase [Pseudomonadota bacterium]
MKRLACLIAAAFALPAGAGQVPGMDAFFDAMAISVKPGQASRFVVGDNLAGYYEGYTQGYGKGQGYVMREQQAFQDFATYVDGKRNERAGAAQQVLPYGHRARFANGAHEEMALLTKQRAVAMTVRSDSATALAIQPMLAKAPLAISANLVVAGPFANAYVALAADQPFTTDELLVLRAASPATSFTVVAAYGNTPEEAARRARELVAAQPIETQKRATYAALTTSYLATDDLEYNKALNWAKASSLMFVVEEFGKGIWAGLPWFRDNWGRDTFIALPGTLLVSGQFEDARAVLANFARYQNLNKANKGYGRIPNRVAVGDIIYNTVDGTPWMLREALEYIRYTGDREFAAQMYKLAVPYFEGAIANYIDQDGLLTHDSADTWMDARIEGQQPWSARGPRAVEIQALWYSALQSGAYLAEQAGDQARARQWRALAQETQRSFLSKFWDGKVMADRLREDGSRDTKVRPNQLMLVTIPEQDFVPPEVQAKVTRNAVNELLYPYGIASLSQDDPYFHPRHENPAFHHKDAAYHQGTIWGWNAGFTVTALNKFGYQDMAWTLTRNLGTQILGLGTLGTMSELLDALPPLKPSGTFAQSWSVAEYARNGYQDYVGFRPNLLENTLAFTPAIPAAWTSFYAVLPFGRGEQLEVDYRHGQWTLLLKGPERHKVRFNFLNADKSRSQTTFDLAPGKRVVVKLKKAKQVQASQAATIGKLAFRVPKTGNDFPVLQSQDVLKGIVLRNEYR